MSDLPQGPGWWRASDGLYYPPEARPGYTPDPDPDASDSDPSGTDPTPPPTDGTRGPTGWSDDEAPADEPTIFDLPPVDPTRPGEPTPSGMIDDDLYERDRAVEDEAEDEPERRRLLPVLALVAVAGLLAGVAIWFVLDGVDDSDSTATSSTTTTDPEPSGSTTTEAVTTTTADGQASPFDLAVGDCFDAVEVEEGDGLLVNTVRLIDCDDPHQAEVVSLEVLDAAAGEPFPGSEARDAAAREMCLAPVEEFLGGSLAESTLLLLWLAPTAESWADDDREVVCVLAAPDGQTLTGSMAGTGGAGGEAPTDDEG